MALYDDLRSQYSQASPQDKLDIMRDEVMRHIPVIAGKSALLQEIGKADPDRFPDDYLEWCHEIFLAAIRIVDIIEGLTDTDENNRETRRQGSAERSKTANAQKWEEVQHNHPELKNYDNLTEAISKTFDKLGLTFPDADKLYRFEYVGSLLLIEKPSHKMSVSIDPFQAGYRVILVELVDKVKFLFQSYEGKTKSLEEVCRILQLWMIEDTSIDTIRDKYPWIEAAPKFE